MIDSIDANVIGELNADLLEELKQLHHQTGEPSGRYYSLLLIDMAKPFGERTSTLTFVIEADHALHMDVPGIYSFVATGSDSTDKMMIALETIHLVRNGIAVRPIG